MRKKFYAAGLAVALVAGCTSGDDSSDTTSPAEEPAGEGSEAPTDSEAPDETEAPGETETPESTEPPEESEAAEGTDAPDETDEESVDAEPAADEFVDQSLDGPAPGVTDDSIRVGITYVDLGSVENVSNNHGDYEATFSALIDRMNADGGINGRQIEPVIVPISFADGGNADAVCVQLTEDEEVFLVMGFFFADAPACYLETHQKAIVGGNMNEDLLDRAQAPWFTFEIGSDFERDAINLLAEQGQLDGTIGVYGAIDNQPLIDGTILPTLAGAGIEPVEVAINDAPANDTIAGDQQNATILQRFEAAGVDTVVATGNDALGIAQALETTGYRPRIVSTNYQTLFSFANDEAERDLSVLEGAVTAGTFGPFSAIFSEPDMAECVDTTTAAGLDWVHPDDWVEGPRPWISLLSACRNLALFEAIATYAGPNLNYATFTEAGETIGAVAMPGYPEPFVYGPRPSLDGDQPLYIWRWDADAEDFVIDS